VNQNAITPTFIISSCPFAKQIQNDENHGKSFRSPKQLLPYITTHIRENIESTSIFAMNSYLLLPLPLQKKSNK
jgi:hypothetical protein